MSEPRRQLGIDAVALFFVFGSVMSALALLLLLYPDSPLEPLWKINPRAREGFAAMGWLALLLLAAVFLACAAAARGIWTRARWGYRTAMTILCINLLADAINGLMGDKRTLIGIPVGGALIAYLVTRRNNFVAR